MTAFVPQMTVEQALALHPSAKWVFAAYHVGGCNSCVRAEGETLEELAAGYKLPLESFLRDLNSLLAA